jgi:hypothetical protein
MSEGSSAGGLLGLGRCCRLRLYSRSLYLALFKFLLEVILHLVNIEIQECATGFEMLNENPAYRERRRSGE